MQKQDILHTRFFYTITTERCATVQKPLFISVEVTSVNRNHGLVTYIFYKAVDIISAFFPEKLCQYISLASRQACLSSLLLEFSSRKLLFFS